MLVMNRNTNDSQITVFVFVLLSKENSLWFGEIVVHDSSSSRNKRRRWCRRTAKAEQYTILGKLSLSCVALPTIRSFTDLISSRVSTSMAMSDERVFEPNKKGELLPDGILRTRTWMFKTEKQNKKNSSNSITRSGWMKPLVNWPFFRINFRLNHIKWLSRRWKHLSMKCTYINGSPVIVVMFRRSGSHTVDSATKYCVDAADVPLTQRTRNSKIIIERLKGDDRTTTIRFFCSKTN